MVILTDRELDHIIFALELHLDDLAETIASEFYGDEVDIMEEDIMYLKEEQELYNKLREYKHGSTN